jgi:BASS family bile acid:Na+ symporter
MNRIFSLLANLFPVWVAAASGLALFWPSLFVWFDNDFIVWGLAVVMLGMGITLSFEDFSNVLNMPRAIAAGFIAQYLIMPFLGWAIAHLLQLPTPYAVGLILVACCPGGTASNVVTYIAKAHVPLSVLMTMCSTFGAIIMTPLLTKFLAGTYVPVSAWGLFVSTVQVVLLPLMIGLFLHQFFPRAVQFVMPVAPLIAVIAVALICASIIGQNAEQVWKSGGILLLAVLLLHAGGFALGYFFARILGYHEQVCRTISIEVGMQNSGLGVVLAKKHFPEMPLTPVPCAISAVFHSVIGSILAGIWRLTPPKPHDPPQPPPRKVWRTTSTHDEQIGMS